MLKIHPYCGLNGHRYPNAFEYPQILNLAYTARGGTVEVRPIYGPGEYTVHPFDGWKVIDFDGALLGTVDPKYK